MEKRLIKGLISLFNLKILCCKRELQQFWGELERPLFTTSEWPLQKRSDEVPFKTPLLIKTRGFWMANTIYIMTFLLRCSLIPVVRATKHWTLFRDPQAEKSSINFAQFDRCTMLTMSVNITQCAQHITHAQFPWEPGLTGLQHSDVLFWSYDVINEIFQMTDFEKEGTKKAPVKWTVLSAHAFINN